jgi:hypothetical protein
MTASGLVVGAFVGFMGGCFLLMAIVGTAAITGTLMALAILPCIAVGAAACAFSFGRGERVQFVAAKEIREDLVHCAQCGTKTWHVIRTFDFGRRSAECMSCQFFRWLD